MLQVRKPNKEYQMGQESAEADLSHLRERNGELMMPCEEVQKRGLCSGDCCGPILKDDDTMDFNKETGKCNNLGDDFKCKIYETRPEVCRLYGTIEKLQCPYIDLRGKIRTPAKMRRATRQINHKVDEQIKTIERRIKWNATHNST